jgi:hypothetical protein
LKRVLVAVALVTAGIPLAAATAEARVGIGTNLGFPPIVAPPVVVAPPLVVAPPPVVAAPPVVVGPPPYYVLPPGYYYAPGHGYYWYDRFGRRHWAR